MSRGIFLDFIGSDDLEDPMFEGKTNVRFLNLRGDQTSDAGAVSKVVRVLQYYARLIGYAATAKPKIFHLLWNNKFQTFDRTLLMLYYKLLGKKTALTVHNVNIRRRDGSDTALNRFTLKAQYELVDHIFVHTEQMTGELGAEFGVSPNKVTVIPFGINKTVRNSSMTKDEARKRLGVAADERAILFFGNITPYKGLEYLVSAFQTVAKGQDGYRLLIAGRPKSLEGYWQGIQDLIRGDVESGKVLLRSDYIPDDETEVFFKAADVLVLPYRHIYQSGVLFLGYSFGLPVLAADVGALKEEILEGQTGFVFRAEDSADLAKTIERYFASDLFKTLESRRHGIREYAEQQHSWDVVGELTEQVYSQLLGRN